MGGGAGTAAQNLAERFAQMGHEVVVVTAKYGRLRSGQIAERLRVVRCFAWRRHPARSNTFEQMIFIVSSLWASLRLLVSWKPDVTLAFFGIPSGVTARILEVLTGTPYVVSLRGGDVPGARPGALYLKLAEPVLHHIWRKARAVVANSSGLRDLAQEFEPDLDIQVIPNGVDTDQFRPASALPEVPRILYVGRLAHVKGTDILLEAVRDLKSLSWECVLVGDGPLRETVEQFIVEHGLEDRVSLVGWVERESLPEIYRQASIFVLPSRQEGMPNALLEAMASGLPSVATRVPGSEELILDEETGLLVPAGAADELRRALEELGHARDRRAKMGRAARRYVENGYSWKKVAHSYLDLLRQIV